MITPIRERTRRTPGGQRVAEYVDRNGLRAVAVYLPQAMHRALVSTAIDAETSLQALMALACDAHYSKSPTNMPPLVAPTRTKLDPHKSAMWYADVDLHKKMKLLAVELDGSVQQLILSALVEHLKDAPRVKALNVASGFPPYARAPAELPDLQSCADSRESVFRK